MVDIPCGVAGVIVQRLAVMEIQQEVVSARTFYPQVLMRKIARTSQSSSGPKKNVQKTSISGHL